MRVRFTGQPTGCIDGIRLTDFAVGSVYEVATLLGCYFLAEGLAEPVGDDVPVTARVDTRFNVINPLPSSHSLSTPEWANAVITEAADRAGKK